MTLVPRLLRLRMRTSSLKPASSSSSSSSSSRSLCLPRPRPPKLLVPLMIFWRSIAPRRTTSDRRLPLSTTRRRSTWKLAAQKLRQRGPIHKKKHGETGTAGQVAGEAEARKSKEAEQQAILECGFGYFDDIAEAPHDNRSNPIDGLFELEEDDEDDEDEEEEDLLANMTPISGLENLSESIVVRGVRYHPQGKPRARSSGTEKKRQTHNRNENLSCETSESPPQTRHSRHRSQGAAPTPAEVRRNKARARKLATMSHSPVSRSRPIPIPDSPVLRGKLLKSKSFNGGLDMGINDFAIGGGRAVDFDFDVHGHAQGFHDFGNSYRDHGQGFAFNMSL
eukprot:INCI9962.2.p1 GENE.INCI9962.2~~INCI9962.2.p1  ORF type:complete len:337 (+),score=48.39 INCI9962.2:224-1234(+)